MNRLPHGQLLSLYPSRDAILHVKTGRLWITTDQSQDDYFVHAGETLALPGGAHVVVEAWNQNKLCDAVFVFDGA